MYFFPIPKYDNFEERSGTGHPWQVNILYCGKKTIYMLKCIPEPDHR